MSELIDNIFTRSRTEFGFRQKPNWAGVVYGICMNPKCNKNYRRSGFYIGGFCKACSIRDPNDYDKDPISTVNMQGVLTNIPNPRIRWLQKSWVKDISERLTAEQKREFYMTPEEKRKYEDTIDYEPIEKEDEEELISVNTKKKEDDEDLIMVE